MFFPPFILIFVVFFFFLLIFLFGLIHWGLISYAFVKIGADLMNLDKIKKLGAPVASIGGAGTFDGIFSTGVLAVLLA